MVSVKQKQGQEVTAMAITIEIEVASVVKLTNQDASPSLLNWQLSQLLLTLSHQL